MSTDKEKGKHPLEGFEHVLTIDMLIEKLNELKKTWSLKVIHLSMLDTERPKALLWSLEFPAYV